MDEFNAVLAELSHRFVAAPMGKLEAAIYDALGAISECFDVERSHIYVFDEDREQMRELTRWPPGGIAADADEMMRAIPLRSLPYYGQELFANRIVAVAEIDEIPSAAISDREFLRRIGVRSAISVPMQAENETIGVMSLSTVTRGRAWSDEDLALSQRAAAAFAPALTRCKAEREHLETLHFERLITSLVSEFMNLPADDLDDGLERALETIARFVDCDRSALFVLDESGDFASLYRGWWAYGVAQLDGSLTRIDTRPGAVYRRWLDSDDPHLAFGPEEIAAIRPDSTDRIELSDLGTVASFPLVIGDRRIGWFCIGAPMPRVSWSTAEVRSLGVAANALANMYSRDRSEEFRRRHQRFEDTLSRLAVDFIKRPPAQLRTGIEELVDGFARFARSDRAAIMLFDENDQTAVTYHEWSARMKPAHIRGFPLSKAPWFHKQILQQGGPWFLHAEDLADLDPFAAATLRTVGIRTLLNCTIADGENVFGLVILAYREARYRPLPGTEQILAIAAGIIANALLRERLEERARQEREALSRAQRMGTLGQLAAGIAHEVNQPLTAIFNYSRACARRLEQPGVDRASITRILDGISGEAMRAGDIIRNLRNQVRGGPKKRGLSPVGEIVERACTLLAGDARSHNVTIQTQLPKSLPQVRVDATDMGQVVINIVQNAIESIAAADVSVREVRIAARRKGPFIQIEIVDSGPGFVTGELSKAFDQFYTTKPGGLGLGLSISKGLLEANGGSLTAIPSSTGACLSLMLPVARVRSPNSKKPANPKRHSKARSKA